MPPLKVRLFARFSISIDDQAMDGLEASKVQELLCYLLLHHDHPQSRESLRYLLWPESSADQAKRNLRQTLWLLQTALQSLPLEPGAPHLIDSSSKSITLRSNADLWLDVMVFEQAFVNVRGVSGEELDYAQVRNVADAVVLRTGRLLEGWYQDWCLQDRERFEGMHRVMLAKLISNCAVHANYERGLDYGEMLLAFDRARESTHRQLMRLYYLNGDRTEALRQYERCVVALAEEFGVKPSRRIVTLYEQIRADHLPSSDPAAVQPADRLGGNGWDRPS